MNWEAVCAMEKPQVLNSDQGSNSISTITEWVYCLELVWLHVTLESQETT